MSFLESLFNIFKAKKPPKSDEELLLDEYAMIYAEIKEKNLNEYDFLCELIRLLSFSRARRYQAHLNVLGYLHQAHRQICYQTPQRSAQRDYSLFQELDATTFALKSA